MTLSTFGSIQTHVGDGSTKSFQAPYLPGADSTCVVRVDGTLKTIGTDFTLNRDGSTPYVVFGTAPAVSAAINIARVTPRDPQKVSPALGNDFQAVDILRELLDAGLEVVVPFAVNATDLAANTAQQLVAPANGRLVGLNSVVQATITTGGTITPGIAGTPVVGWGAHSHAAKLAVGNTVSSVPADPSVVTASVRKGNNLRLTLASFATAGALTGNLIIRPWG